MKLYTVMNGYFKLDGGAMFGVVPKSIWNKLNPADENNMCSWAMRSLLIEDGNRLILVDNGMGEKQDAKFFGYYHLHGDDSLQKSLHKLGFSQDDITDVFLTHLHFDHCGGSIRFNNDRTGFEPAFKNAIYWSNEAHWKAAVRPNQREKASFLKENILPIQESGQLKFATEGQELFPGIQIMYSQGHTESQMHPMIQYKGKTVVFMADLLASAAHIPMPYVMAYDMHPLTTMEEKGAFFAKAAKDEYVLFLEHDKDHACCTVHETEKGIRLKDTFSLESYFG